MDSLTQIVLGAAVGEVVLGKKIGNKAILWGAIAGTIPDLDVFVGLFKETIAHRGFTHSFAFAFIMSPILAFLMTKVFPWSKALFKDWMYLYFWGFVTHILLDVQTIYGTELLWPFRYRLTTANVFVVDPLYTVPFLICVILVMFTRRNKGLRRKINIFGLGLSTSYLLLTFVFKGMTMKQFTNNLARQDIRYNRIETGPTPFNSILWYANVETDSAYYVGHYSLLDKSEDISFKKFDKNFELRKKYKDYNNFKRLNHFSKDWYVLRQKDSVISYSNMRFGTSAFKHEEMEYNFNYQLNIENGVLKFKNPEMKGKSKVIKKMFKILWNRIKGI